MESVSKQIAARQLPIGASARVSGTQAARKLLIQVGENGTRGW